MRIFVHFLALCVIASTLVVAQEYTSEQKRAIIQQLKLEVFQRKVVNYVKGWNFHGKLNVACDYDSNINEAPDAQGLNPVKDGNTSVYGHFLVERLLPSGIHTQFSADGIFSCYWDRDSLNWNNVRIASGSSFYPIKKLRINLSAHWLHHYQPNVLNDASELINEHFTNDFSHYEYALNPRITYQFGRYTNLAYSNLFMKQIFKNSDHRIPYNNLRNLAHVIFRHKINDLHFYLIGSRERIVYKHLPPYYGGAQGAAGNLATNEKKKLRSYSGKISVGYDFKDFMPSLAYKYKYQDDRFEDYDTFRSHHISVRVPIRYGSCCTIPNVAYEHRRFKNRIVSTTDFTKVHYTIYNVGINQEWQINKNTMLNGLVGYDRRLTNVHSGRLDRKYSRFIAKIGINYKF